jgi:hypothetical protein
LFRHGDERKLRVVPGDVGIEFLDRLELQLISPRTGIEMVSLEDEA